MKSFNFHLDFAQYKNCGQSKHTNICSSTPHGMKAQLETVTKEKSTFECPLNIFSKGFKSNSTSFLLFFYKLEAAQTDLDGDEINRI